MNSFYKKRENDIYLDPYSFTETWKNSADCKSLIKDLYDIYNSKLAVNVKRHFSDCKICGPDKEAKFIDPYDLTEKSLTACDLLIKKSKDGNYIAPSIILHVIQKHNLKPETNVLDEFQKNK